MERWMEMETEYAKHIYSYNGIKYPTSLLTNKQVGALDEETIETLFVHDIS